MLTKFLNFIIIAAFLVSCIIPQPSQSKPLLGLPEPGTMVSLSPAYEPPMIKGLTVHKDNPFLFDFIVDVGQDRYQGDALREEGAKLIKYFLASLAIPEKDLWVNLSPFEQDRIIPEALSQTDMGRDLLAQDYVLKQITASLIYPENELGKVFWRKVHSKAQQLYGTSQVPVNTFNKVWIMADRAEVFERNNTVFVTDSHLKVMLEEDYLALRKSEARNPKFETNSKHQNANVQNNDVLSLGHSKLGFVSDFDIRDSNLKIRSVASQIVRDIILPELEKEVNTGKNFANLRQIFNSLILAAWYKENLKTALINQVYSDQGKIKGINLKDPAVKDQIYQRYLQAYKKGVFNFIKEDFDKGQMVPRKYFSGGFGAGVAVRPSMTHDPAVLAKSLPTDRAMAIFQVGVQSSRLRQVTDALAWSEDRAMSVADPNPIPPALTVVVVEDEAFLRDLRRLQLEQKFKGAGNVTVLVAEDGAAALRLISEIGSGSVFVLTDLNMPNMDGLALSRVLLGVEGGVKPYPRVKNVVMLTGNAGMELGEARDLLKPENVFDKLVRTSMTFIGDMIEQARKSAVKEQGRPMHPSDQAQTTPTGGIDLDTTGLKWKARKDGRGVEMNINPAMIARIKREGIEGLTPVIFRIMPVANIASWLGLESPP